MPLNEILKLPSGPLDNYRLKASFDWRSMKVHLESEKIIRFKHHIWSLMNNDPLFHQKPWEEIDRSEFRKLTFLRLKKIFEYNMLSEENYIHDPYLVPAMIQCLIQFDTSLAAKKFMSLDNFFQALKLSGSKSHQKVLDDVLNFRAMGALTITELGHGSNVKGLRTTATYDPATREFVIHTPDLEAIKVFSGVLGQTATHAIVYAQLYTPDGQCHGLHSFLVPVRDPETLLPFSGVTVGDMGPKVGIEGMDNGFARFHHYRIPKDALMNKNASVTDDGRFVSKTRDNRKHSYGILSLGRLSLTYVAVLNLESAIVIAVRYAGARKQFGPSGEQEIPILEYQSHQWRLIPYIAACYIMRVFFFTFYEDFISFYATIAYELNAEMDTAAVGAEVHALSCAAKAISAWIARDGIQECREACGGYGFLKAARLDELRRDHDANTTHEGDNNVIIQQTSNYLLKAYENKIEKGEEIVSMFNTINYLNDIESILKETIPDDLESIESVLKMYYFLICVLLRESKLKLNQELKKSNTFEAKNNCQVYYLRTLTLAFYECNALQRFWNFSSQSYIEPEAQSVLHKLGLLFGLWSIDKYISFLYDVNYIPLNRGTLKTIRSLILQLCAQLKNDAVSLVDVLAPPDFVLKSSLGHADGKIYEHIYEAIINSKDSTKRPFWFKEFTKQKPKRQSML